MNRIHTSKSATRLLAAGWLVLSATAWAQAPEEQNDRFPINVAAMEAKAEAMYARLHTVHGRALPAATGLKLARTDLTVLAVGGDGDFFSIGLGHLPHAARRNINITCIAMDNEIYGLTKGQTSPTSPVGHITKSTPLGNQASPLHPLAIVLSSGATFVARGFSSQPKHLAELIRMGIEHKCFALIQAISPCVSFYDTYKLYKEKV